MSLSAVDSPVSIEAGRSCPTNEEGMTSIEENAGAECGSTSRAEGDEENYDEELADKKAAESLQDTIKVALEDALDSSSSFDGTYAVCKPYKSSQAVPPCLDIEGFGTVGLPLSHQAAARLRLVCQLAPFGKGERTVVDREVRDTWEVDPSKIQFLNPEWEEWVKGEVLTRVCEGLGVSNNNGRPRCELYKLLLYETGSHFLPHQDTEKADGMFATMVIVLPTCFEGGQVHVSFGQDKKVFDTSAASLHATTALAWYTDVMHEVKPIQSGYRLALSYNLFHTAASYKPSPPSLGDSTRAIAAVLRAWRYSAHTDTAVRDERAPSKLAYILEHEYSQANLSLDKLKGKDAALVSDLRTACQQIGFRLALASLNYTQTGLAEDHGGYGGGDVSMMEVEGTACSIEVIDGPYAQILRGKTADLDTDELMAPEDYFEGVEPDDQDYEGYLGNGAGSLEYFYHRTVLLLWPESQDLKVVQSIGGIEAAVQTLGVGTATSPSNIDLSLVNAAFEKHIVSGLRTVADAAVRWGDAQLWKRAADTSRAGSGIDVFGKDRLLNAWSRFGFQLISPILEDVISETGNTTTRLEFVSVIEQQSQGMDLDEDAKKAMKSWCQGKTRSILSTLKKPTRLDVSAIVASTLSFGNLETLRDLVLPQLAGYILPVEWWLPFVMEMQRVRPNNETFDWVQPVFALMSPILDETLLLRPSNASRYEFIKQVEKATQSLTVFNQWCAQKQKWSLENIRTPCGEDVPLFLDLMKKDHTVLKSFLLPKLSSEPYLESYWLAFLEKMSVIASEADNNLPEDWENAVCEALDGPLRRALEGCLTNHECFTFLSKLGNATATRPHMVEFISRHRWAILNGLKTPTVKDVQFITQFVRLDTTYGLSSLLPQLTTFECTDEFWKVLIRAVHKDAGSLIEHGWQPEGVTAFVTALAQTAVAQAVINPVPKPPTTSHNTGLYAVHTRTQATPTELAAIIDWIAVCVETGNSPLASTIIWKAISVCTDNETTTHTLIPLFPLLLQALNAHHLTPNSPPFDVFFRHGIRAYIKHILGPKPDAQHGKKWGGDKSSCNCRDCQEVNVLIMSSRSPVVWRAAQYRRTHVQSFLRSIAGLTMTTVASGSPHGLQVTKDLQYTKTNAWKDHSETGLKLLRSIGSDQALQQLWKGDGGLDVIVSALKGDPLPPTRDVQPAISQLVASAQHSASTVPRKRKAVHTGDAIDLTLDDE